MGMPEYTQYMIEKESFKESIREAATTWFDEHKPEELDNGRAATCLRQLADELEEIHREQEGR